MHDNAIHDKCVAGEGEHGNPEPTNCCCCNGADLMDDPRAIIDGTEGTIGSVLVVGGGIAGMQSALDLANSDFKVYMIDTSPAIGGTMAQLDKTFPTNDCAMCIMSPKLVDVGRHPNIDLYTYAEIEEVTGSAGNFTVQVRKKARYVDVDKCTGCGVCASECPIDAISTFNEGLSEQKTIYVPYPQAVPLVYTIDRMKCIGCGLCENLCLADAILYDCVEEIVPLKVGSIIVCPGYDEFDPTVKSEYGYGRFPNVISSIEFERILSASGPFKGHVLRPSDGDMPTRIAWIQCVGSRDNACGNNYCSSVCCTYSIKEAVIAKEHISSIEPTIFFMDMRTHGKGFEEYYNRAKNEFGVRFVRCRVAGIREDPESNNLHIKYESEDGQLLEEEFELVVLSVGFEPKKNVLELADKLDIKLNHFGFCETTSLAPIDTSRQGVFVCGAFSGPKDIPETVTEASGAAAKASSVIASQRSKLVTRRDYPPERDVSGEDPRVGVFICHCGINIGGYLDVSSVVDYARSLDNVVFAEENLYTCSQDTQEKMVERIRENDLNRVIVASCTPRTHEPLFQSTIREAGLNPYLFEMANIRDQCSWVHMKKPELATDKAKDLVRIAVSKARLIEPLEEIAHDVIQKALVIGGGLAGMVSALSIAVQGYETYIVEREETLGGNLRRIHYLIDGEETKSFLEKLIRDVHENPHIKVYTGANIESIDGNIGNFNTTLIQGSEKTELQHGAVIVATGAEESKPSEYHYGDEHVMTQLELEERITTGEDFSGKTIVMIQCVGSREEGRPYCSRICCTDAVKNALKLKKEFPDSEIYILYRDMRTYGFFETYYEEARQEGIIFIRFDQEEKPQVTPGESGFEIDTRDKILNEDIQINADVLVLSPAIIPHADNIELAKHLKVPLNKDGFFLEAHVKLRPVDFATDGVFLAGMAHSPKTIGETISQAHAAASRAITVISKDKYVSKATISWVVDSRCDGCAYCVDTCPYGAITLIEYMKDGQIRKTIDLNEAICKGCGVCMATCPKEGVYTKGFTYEQIMTQGKSAVEITGDLPPEEDFEPRIVAFCCNWCSYAGADLAGVSRFQYPPNVRVIRVMCSGMVHPNFVIETLMAGADGVVMCGCHPGDCHYLEGNLRAESRAEALELMLEDYGLEPERYRLEWVSASEGQKFAEVMRDMAELIKELGPSPYRPY